MGPAAHAEDAIAVVDDAGAETFDIAAWSTGTRIAEMLMQLRWMKASSKLYAG